MPGYLKWMTIEQRRIYRNHQRKLNYGRGLKHSPDYSWRVIEEIMVYKHEGTDRELSRTINRSVQAIQVKRCRLRKRWGGRGLKRR